MNNNKAIVKLAEECGFYAAQDNPEALWKEVEFLVEQAVRRCADIAMCYDFDAQRVILSQFDIPK
jgi:hypothetical protein